MSVMHDPHNVRDFVRNLAAGTRVVWIANGVKGTVQPDKAIAWDDGSRMSPRQMSDSHALLIHGEEEWMRMNESLRSMLNCPRCGWSVERWDSPGLKGKGPEKICPLAVLSDPEPVPRPPQRTNGAVRLGPPRMRRPLRA
jgi:hypothetical protein